MTMAARIVALVNRFDNLCNPHLLARALTPHESLALLFAQWRSQFDTSILSAFIKMMGVYPPGSVVQLTDDRYGLVMAVNSARPLKPSVLVHDLGGAARRSPGARSRIGGRPRHPAQPEGPAAAAEGARLPVAEPAGLLLLRAGAGRMSLAPMSLPNPLPVEPFSIEEAARRTWPMLIEAMLDAVCLVEPEGLRIVAANGAAGRLLGTTPAELVGSGMKATAATPEDEAFWQEVAEGRSTGIVSESLVVRAGGEAVPVLRRVSRVEPAPGIALYVVTLHDRGSEVRRERAAAIGKAELAATLESVADGVLVLDLGGAIRHFNRRFAALWEIPEDILLLGGDAAIFEWMLQAVEVPAAQYLQRLAEIDAGSDPAQASGRAVDVLQLRRGASVERVSLPQLSRGQLIGRVFSFRELAA